MDGFRLTDPKERPDLLIFEPGENVDKEFKDIETLLGADAIGEFYITSSNTDTDLLLRAMRAGSKEFLKQPLNEREVRAALENFQKRRRQTAFREQTPAHDGKIIHLMGAKGGVGTTTVAVNMALILAEKFGVGAVALVDLNTVFGEVPMFLSVQPNYHWGQIAKHVNRLDATFLLNAMAKHESGAYILPAPNYVDGNLPATEDIIERLLHAMKQTFDIIIIDGGQALDGPALKVIEMSDQVFLITELNLSCLQNCNRLLKSLEALGVIDRERVSLVVNRYMKRSDISIEEAVEAVRKEIFRKLPNDYRTTQSAINRGVPLHKISSRAEIVLAIEDLAKSLLSDDIKVKPKENKSRWKFFGN
jgi:pilus assembly protein CpaE